MGELDNQNLDEQARADVRAERQRYTTTLAALRTDDAAGFVAEYERHQSVMRGIMARLTARRVTPAHLHIIGIPG